MVSFEGEVYAVKTLGRENIVTLLIDSMHVKVVAPPEVAPREGRKMLVNVSVSKFNSSDPKTELNLEYLAREHGQDSSL